MADTTDIRDMLGDIYQREVDGQILWFAESLAHSHHKRVVYDSNYRRSISSREIDTKTNDKSEKAEKAETIRLRRLLSVDSGLSILSSSSPAPDHDTFSDHLNEVDNVNGQSSLRSVSKSKSSFNLKPKSHQKTINRTVFVSLKVKRLSNVNNVEQTVEIITCYFVLFSFILLLQ